MGVPKSDKKTFQYHKIAADKGGEFCQYSVGMCYYLGIGVDEDFSLAIKYLSLSADQNVKNVLIDLPRMLIIESKRNRSYLFKAIYRTKCALKIITESHERFALFKDFLEWSKTVCGGCSANGKKETWQIQNLISKPELNGKICEKVETLDNRRVKVKIDDSTIIVKLECLLHNKSGLLACGRCKVIMYCNLNCQKKHWKEGNKHECST